MKKDISKEKNWLLKEKYNGKQSKEFKKDIKRLEKGEPVDYVIGFKEFLGCRIDLSKKLLIPRPETEFWASVAIDEIKKKVFGLKSRTWQPGLPEQKFENLKCLDIFAGSGCVGVAVLANVDGVSCDFADKERNAIAQIKINLKKNLIDEERFVVRQSDIFKKIKNKYDYIFANPPYIPTTRKNKVEKSVIKYEPKKALFGGRDGLTFIKKFLKDAKKYLNKEGEIFMEFDYIQKPKIEKLIKNNKYKESIFYKDQYGKWRWVVIK
jgi:release factor glutamine methyltransferase